MTHPIIDDIRVLKLAEMYERTYERFVLEMASHFSDDETILQILGQLTDPQDDHGARITAELQRLNEKVLPAERIDVQKAALLDVVEIERAAREFYLSHADSVHDPKVAALFRELAREEQKHVRIAEDALAVIMRRPLAPTRG